MESGVVRQATSTYGAAAAVKSTFELRRLLRLLVVCWRYGGEERSAGTAGFRHGCGKIVGV